jgi:hypothetical protein
MKKKNTTKKNIKKQDMGVFKKVIMWFLAIVLVASMVLPAVLGFMW